MKNTLRIVCIFLLIQISFSGNAQETAIDSLYDLSLEELMNVKITTASKQEESLADAGAIVSVITSKDIQSYGALSLVDVLDRAAGMYFTSGFTYRDNMVSIRGNATTDVNTNVLILVDGRPMRESFSNGLNSPVYASFPLERIERLEIIRGPGSILYGTCAVTGVINIITKGAGENTSIGGSLRYGTFNTLQGSLSGSKIIGKLALSAGVALLNTDGWEYSTKGEPLWFPNPVTGDPMLINPNPASADLYKKNVGANLSARMGDFKLSANWLRSKQANMGFEPFWLNDMVGTSLAVSGTEFYTDVNRWMIDLGYEKSLSEKWKTSVNLTNNIMDQDKRYPEIPNLYDFGGSRDYLLEVTNYVTPTENLNIVIGGLVNYQTGVFNTYQMNNGVNVALDPTPHSNPSKIMDYDELWWSFYAQGSYNVTSNFKLIGGVQGNKVTNLDLDIVPRGGAIYHFNDNLGIKVLYGKAFRSPSQYERNVQNIPQITKNPDLKPEKISTIESQLFFNRKTYEVSLTYYNSKQYNVIRQGIVMMEIFGGSIFPVSQYVNAGELHSSGFELEGKIFVNAKLSLNGSATYQHTEDAETGKDVFGMPRFMGKLGVNYSPLSGLSVGLFNSYFGNGENIDQPTTTQINPAASAHNYLSANIQYDLGKLFNSSKSLVFSVYATNILDEKIYYPEYTVRSVNTFPGRSGRAVYGSLTFKL